MTDATYPTPTTAALHECVTCEVRMIGGTAVALLESATGPGRLLYACAGCIKFHDLLPLDEQTTLHGDGRLQYRGQ
jgi:hypothetical protein